MTFRHLIFFTAVITLLPRVHAVAEVIRRDVVIYGGTSAVNPTRPTMKNGMVCRRASCIMNTTSAFSINRVPFPRPQGYDPAEFELMGRIMDAGWLQVLRKFDPVPNRCRTT